MVADCGKYDDMISALIDGELTDNEVADLEEHARNCRSCAELIMLYSAMSSSMNELEEAPPNNLSSNIMGQIRHDSKKSKKRRGLRRLTAVAAVLVVVISGLILNRAFPFNGSSDTASMGDSAVMEAASETSTEDAVAGAEDSQPSSADDITTDNPSSYAEVKPSEVDAEAETEPEQSASEEAGQTFGTLGEESSVEVFYTDSYGNDITMPVDVTFLNELLTISGVYSKTVTGEPICKIIVTDDEEKIYRVWVSNETVLVQDTNGVLYISDISLERLKSFLP